MAENKVQFGLKNVYYAVLTESASAAPSFGTPKAIPGAVTLTLSHESADTNFYADNVPYFRTSSNNGYSGSLEMARFTEDMFEDIWGLATTSSGVLSESNKDTQKPFALMFQIDGDSSNDLYVFYRCFASRPNVGSTTINEGGKEPQTQTCDLTVLPVIDPTHGSIEGKVYAKTGAEATTTVRAAWFSTVFTSF